MAPADGSTMEQEPKKTSAALIAGARQVRGGCACCVREDHRRTPEDQLAVKARGQVVMEAPRYEMIQDTINHWAHHRGQMTVYLRLIGAKVPAIYGPSADDNQFR